MSKQAKGPVAKPLLVVLGCCLVLAMFAAQRLVGAESRPSETGFGPAPLARVDQVDDRQEPWVRPSAPRDPFRPFVQTAVAETSSADELAEEESDDDVSGDDE